MKDAELQRLFDLENTYWWFVGTRNVIERRLRQALRGRAGLRILDLGAGSGIMMDRLGDLGTVVGLDLAVSSARFCRDKGHLALVADAGLLPFPDGGFDAVIAADVIEHTPDDERVVRELARVIRPGGVVIVNVPAFMLLWSHHDEAIGHYRRYRRDSLLPLLSRSGFAIETWSYVNFFVFPLFLAARLAQRVFRPRSRPAAADYPWVPGPVNRLFVALLDLEGHLIDRLALPVGTSVLAVGRLPASRAAR